MSIKIKVAIFALVVIGVALAIYRKSPPASAEQSTTFPIGSELPSFSFQEVDGGTYKSEDIPSGTWVAIAWYPKAFTPGCTAESCNLSSANEIDKFKVKVMLASTDTPEKNLEFRKKHSLQLPMISDPKGELATKMGIYNKLLKIAKRRTFIFDGNHKFCGAIDSVETSNAASQLARKLEELNCPTVTEE